jgi:hypothetical protein
MPQEQQRIYNSKRDIIIKAAIPNGAAAFD